MNLHNYSYTKNCLDMVTYQYTILQQIAKTYMWAKRPCSQNQREIIPMHVKLLSYLLQMTEGLIIGSDRLGALWVEVKTLCGFKTCLVSVSVESGNDTEDVFPVGLVAGVPWIGEWHGEERGEIFGGIPGKRKEESCQLIEVADGCMSSLCRNTPLEMCRYQHSFQTERENPSPLWAKPMAVTERWSSINISHFYLVKIWLKIWSIFSLLSRTH